MEVTKLLHVYRLFICIEMLPTVYSDNKAALSCILRPVLGLVRDHIHPRPPHRPIPDLRRHRHVLHAHVVPNSGLGPRDRVCGTDGHRGRAVYELRRMQVCVDEVEYRFY